ncbi:hypothetical protein SESBI_23135 [Sesbania bispinosa]|nr:hypothetical protein SESBI_23135 [Sesbania bispinosa]
MKQISCSRCSGHEEGCTTVAWQNVTETKLDLDGRLDAICETMRGSTTVGWLCFC